MGKEALKHIELYHEEIKKRYSHRVKIRDFHKGYWVLWQVTRLIEQGKMDENCQGPYIMDGISSEGTYIFWTLERDLEEYPWNVSHLKMFSR